MAKEQYEFLVAKGNGYISKGFESLSGGTMMEVKYIGGVMPRKMKLAKVGEYWGTPTQYSSMGNLWVDCVTGTLYDPETGRCLSSDQLTLVQ